MKISVTIITLNEENNISRAIESVRWADEIIVVDSGSTDRTVAIAKELGAKVLQQPWPGYGQQKNFAQDQASNDWVLNLDADEAVTPELAKEISTAIQTRPEAGYDFPRKTFYMGRWIKHGGWYPDYAVRLTNRHKARWTEPNIHERLVVQGAVGRLNQPMHHYTFSNIQEQVLTNLRYSHFGSLELKRKGQQGSLVRMLLKPMGKFIETYFFKFGFLDGLPGLIISINAAHSMFLKYAYLVEAELGNARTDS